MTNGHQLPPTFGVGRLGGTPGVLQVVSHLTVALSRHVRQLRHWGQPVPREIEELAALLLFVARSCQDLPDLPTDAGPPDHPRMPNRLLLTRDEAAALLGVSVRTIARLVSTGRLPQVRVERLARFRVSDLEAFVGSLSQQPGPVCPEAGEIGSDSARCNLRTDHEIREDEHVST